MEATEFNDLKDRLVPKGEETLITAELSTEEIESMTPEQADELVAMYGATTLVRLPESEREYFEWLKEEDRVIWDDLWGGVEENELYYVSMSHLRGLLPGKRGFPICDLAENPNFYFTSDDITEENGSAFVEHAVEVITDKGDLSMDQAFVIEVWRGPIDLWRFAWMYNLPVVEVRKMVHWLLKEEILAVPTQREENPAPIESAPLEPGESLPDSEVN